MWLKDAGGGRSAFFPDQGNEHFEFTADVGYFLTRLVVEGQGYRTRAASEAAAAGSSRVYSMSSGTSSAAKPFFAKKGSSTINVKILKAIVKKGTGNKLEFKSLHQEFVEITESTANVHYLTHVAKEKWGYEYILCTADGIVIEDSSGTQGIME